MHALHGNGSMETFVEQLELTGVPALVAALQNKFGNSQKLRHALNGSMSTIDLCVAEMKWKNDMAKLIKGLAAKFTKVPTWSTRGSRELNSNTRELIVTCNRFLKMLSGDDEAAMLADVQRGARGADAKLKLLIQNLREKFIECSELSIHHPARQWILKAVQGCVGRDDIRHEWGFSKDFWLTMAVEKQEIGMRDKVDNAKGRKALSEDVRTDIREHCLSEENSVILATKQPIKVLI